MQIIKSLGLYSTDTHDITQLSLGVGNGSKDLISIHLEPDLSLSSNGLLEFNVRNIGVNDVVLVDGDPQRKELFNKLNDNYNQSIIAINDNAFDTLSYLPKILNKRELNTRNLVTALRIDHRMIPDIHEFFRLTEMNIDEIATLIVTIGSGSSLEDYKGRTRVLNDMYNFLRDIGLKPLLIKLHGKGSLEEQWNDHAFGLKAITTYEILFCKLKRNILKKALLK
jgi:hypothetical protein